MIQSTAFIPLILLCLAISLVDPAGAQANALAHQSQADLWLDHDLMAPDGTTPGASGQDITIHVNGTLRITPGTVLAAGNGAPGLDAEGIGIAVAEAGGRGGSIRIVATTLIADGVHFVAGDGGPGGKATAFGNPHAVARGGNGGPAGIISLDMQRIVGTPIFHHGDGGSGGEATAEGENGESCGNPNPQHDDQETPPTINPGGHGTTENRTGEAGHHCHKVGGNGGDGGNATAFGGHGGVAPDGNGGNGGNGYAWAGTGGNGGDACFSTRAELEPYLDAGWTRAGDGGLGGAAVGQGGNGGHGVNGGHGGHGFATSTGGNGGTASLPLIGGVGGGTFANFEIPSKGGDGGHGAMRGGNGGGAAAVGYGGEHGGLCNDLRINHSVLDEVPPVSGYLVGLALVALSATALVVRWRRRT